MKGRMSGTDDYIVPKAPLEIGLSDTKCLLVDILSNVINNKTVNCLRRASWHVFDITLADS